MGGLAAAGGRWAIATPHSMASRVGAAAFERGGNAIDAAIAAATVLAVAYPHMCGVGGDLFALVEHPDGAVVAVNASGRAAVAAEPEAIRARHGGQMPERGPDTVTVPGAVAGWGELHHQGATLPWADLLADASAAARDGIPVARSLARAPAEAETRELAGANPGFGDVFLPGGDPLTEGSILRQLALGGTLDALATGGAEAFYRGAIGERLVAGLRTKGLRPFANEDLLRHTAEISPPLVGRYRGLDVRVTPPNSQGFVLLAALATIERLGIDPDPFGRDVAALSRVLRAAARDRDRHLADPATMSVPARALLDDVHIAALCDAIRDGLGRQNESPPRRTGDTIGLVTADAAGFAVSLIQSLSWGFGSGILEPSTGILLHNRGAGFTLEPDHPNMVAGGKRPEHTLMPVLAHRDGRIAAASGSMGGYAQPQLNATSLIRAFDLGMTPLDALAAPRWLVNGMDTEGTEPFVAVEHSVPEETKRSLAAEGLRLDPLEDLDEAAGQAHLIVVGLDGGFEVATDPRADGAALAS